MDLVRDLCHGAPVGSGQCQNPIAQPYGKRTDPAIAAAQPCRKPLLPLHADTIDGQHLAQSA
ncbi:hypothetical protein SAMN05660976_03458 [Nonomuraea pusilla]|uniref:Uncharacterized protein n=1 Tax=Nonomuraea pusilla TaxID=46177 RepID=A0A1H7TGQ4_9ACTN|nr:hypothetical protein SAMN05660976_03458 [Nonomuraea pusilla]